MTSPGRQASLTNSNAGTKFRVLWLTNRRVLGAKRVMVSATVTPREPTASQGCEEPCRKRWGFVVKFGDFGAMRLSHV